MRTAPLAALAEAARAWGAPLDETALARLSSYLREVRARNASVNLTADDAWEDLVLRHAADGVLAAAVLRRELAELGAAPAPRLLDLGAGAGFVGIALKIAWPQAQVTLMEAVERKFRFLNLAAARLALPGLRVLRRRAGAAPARSAYETGFDAVVERALAPLPEALGLAAPLLGPRGLFAAFQSEKPDPAAPALARALAAAQAGAPRAVRYRRPGEERDRFVFLASRVVNR